MDALAQEPVRCNPRTVNTLLLGILASLLPFPRERWLKVMGELIPPKLQEINARSFAAGWELADSKG